MAEFLRVTTIPFKIHSYDEGEDWGMFKYYHVRFLKDWGPIKEHTVYEIVLVDWEHGVLTANPGSSSELVVKFACRPEGS